MWSSTDIPDQAGRVALITGGYSGIGLVTARELAARGATVVIAGRDRERAAAVAGELGGWPLYLDLGDIGSVRRASGEFRDRFGRLDLLVNNAGLMIPPYGRTGSGFEWQFGVNHLGHFALTGLLLDLLRATPEARVVTVSSNGHKGAVIDFEDLQSERGYDAMRAYRQSKLANLLFAFELQRRHPELISVAAHPGAARTRLLRSSPWVFRVVVSQRTKALFSWLVQSEWAGAQPVLRAATDPGVGGGEYFGPDGWKEFTGRATRVTAEENAHDLVVARRLWVVSEGLTGVTYPAGAGMLADGP
ncbi:oxidoreductase [Actinoplanes regularis]|uniref:NAD(P)-dependent dehydrogenase, short-chain alcohol dehydrogenase family n=1 Tax=Actinoplanes regularis TaxID=52697 RepID=A0A238X3G8_9ACTN|nr:oxidoreductase [Actinoplanes regularis]GIE86381.1 putative short-chain dehydrogenase/reductase [Actinoplanes regularis]SNR53123.1 NAD(P)-dependent dehydrogenase, short-chain alcohol dehydrogenase family [Actinoplanes regularis]